MQTHVLFCATAALLSISPLATAEEPEDEVPYTDLHGREPPVTDLVPHPLIPLAEPAARPSLSVAVAWVERPERRDIAGGIVLSFPTDAAAAPRKAKTVPVMEPPGDAPSPRRAVVVRVRPGVARAAVSAALRHRRHGLADERLDDLAARARWSALLPEVRLRATRLIDESSSFSPTSYDPERTTSSGGVSLWLEGRTTWYFDRLVFADQEVRIEQMRNELSKERERISRRVLELLFGWQRAAQRAHDPLVDANRCIEALLDEEQLAVELDMMTDGWFSRWRRDNPIHAPDCAELEAARERRETSTPNEEEASDAGKD